MERRRICERTGCRKRVRRGCRFCSRSCARTSYLLTQLTAEQRQAQMRKAIRMKFQRDIARMVQRVKVLADTEDERLVLAWRLGKSAAKSDRYRQRVGASA